MPDRLARSELLIIVDSLTAPPALGQVVRSHIRHSDHIARPAIRRLLNRGARPCGADAGAADEGLAVRADEEALLAGVAEEALREEVPALAAVEAVEVVVLGPDDLVEEVARELVAVGADHVGVGPRGRLDALGGRLDGGERLGRVHLGHVVIFVNGCLKKLDNKIYFLGIYFEFKMNFIFLNLK